MSMELGMIGLGRMGASMAERLLRGGHRAVGFARNADTRRLAADKGVVPAASLAALVDQLKAPRATAGGESNPLRRCGNQRRRVGPQERLQHHGRRRRDQERVIAWE